MDLDLGIGPERGVPQVLYYNAPWVTWTKSWVNGPQYGTSGQLWYRPNLSLANQQ